MDNTILLQWYKQNARNLPWRETKDPYKIWVSEIILQQTRVAQALPYYKNFLKRFPDIYHLANANEEEVLKIWQGLGYYSRARNMHYTARDIVNNYQGVFPRSKNELLKLKGIGEYTAAAIASFAYKEKVGVVDGNVNRFLSRYYGIDIPVDSYQGKKWFTMKVNEIIDMQHPDLFNQALMEFGALQCKPNKPNCSACPLNKNCVAYKIGEVEKFPIKNKKIKQKIRHLNFFLIKKDEHILVEKRSENDIWKNLYQLPLIETKQEISNISEEQQSILKYQYQIIPLYIKYIRRQTHNLTHQKLKIKFWEVKIEQSTYKFISINQLKGKAFPIIISKFLDNYL